MRILVLSDSHGNVDNMARAVELTAPDRVLHLGDCQRDLTALRAREAATFADPKSVPLSTSTRKVLATCGLL